MQICTDKRLPCVDYGDIFAINYKGGGGLKTVSMKEIIDKEEKEGERWKNVN